LIEYIKGDVCDAFADVIAHGCNCHGKMGSGVAKAIKKKYPLAFQIYAAIHSSQGLELGQLMMVRVSFSEIETQSIRQVWIANLMTQDQYGYDGKQYCDYDAIRVSLRKLKEWCIENDKVSIAMPKIGSGLGGGDWGIISAIIEEELSDLKVMIYEYE